MVNLHYLSRIFKTIADIKDNDHVAEVQTNPQVPSPLSESIILHLLRDGKIKLFDKGQLKFGDFKETPGWEFRKGGYGDITGKNRTYFAKIEVKGTGGEEFISFGEQDKMADYLFWLSFGNSIIKKVVNKRS